MNTNPNYRQSTLTDQLLELVVPHSSSCWHATFWAMMDHLSRQPQSTVYYVEGWLLVRDKVAMEHAWLEIDGNIVDVVFSSKYFETAYRAAYRYASEPLLELLLSQASLPLFANLKACEGKLEYTFATLPKETARIQIASGLKGEPHEQN